jgi:integrase
MTSPLHGEGRAFESPRAHRLFFQSGPTISAEAKDELGEELCNYQKKLCNFRTLDNIQRLARHMTDRYFDDEGNEQIEMLDQELIPEAAHDIDWNDPSDPYALKAEAKLREALKRESEEEAEEQAKAEQVDRNLTFTKDELDQYVTYRTKGIAQKSRDWIFRSSKALWAATHGEISHDTVNALRDSVLEKYDSPDSHSKVLSFAKAFFKFLATTKAEPRYLTFFPYLEPPKTVKERKRVTSRIVTEDDICNILRYIDRAEREGKIRSAESAQYSAIVLFGAYTGQRTESTIERLTVGQFREGMAVDKPVLQVDSSQDKNRMSHYVPLHPRVVEALKPLLVGRHDDELVFEYSSFKQWIKRQKIPMSRIQKHFVPGDLRKFAEQHGDVIQWDQSNRAYILTHDVSGVSWSHYRSPLPENIYVIYMEYWRNVELSK